MIILWSGESPIQQHLPRSPASRRSTRTCNIFPGRRHPAELRERATSSQVAGIQANYENVQENKRGQHLANYSKKDEKVKKLQERKRAELEALDLAQAERHLRIVDVLDKKNRIERQRDAKKDMIKQDSLHSHQRIATLLSML